MFRSLDVAVHSKLLKRARFRNFQVYQKNFDACVQTAKMNRDSIERMRFNEPDGAIPKIPDCRDLGYILRDMAKTIQEYSFQLARLSGKNYSDYCIGRQHIRLKHLFRIEAH